MPFTPTVHRFREIDVDGETQADLPWTSSVELLSKNGKLKEQYSAESPRLRKEL
jgi:hypothetical protein